MKKIAILSLSALIFTACGEANQPNVATSRQTTNTASAPPPVSPNNSGGVSNNGSNPIVSSHSTEQTASNPAAETSASSQSPVSKPVDVSAMTAKIEKAEKEYKAKPDDDKVKNNLAETYFERAFALTKAAQYRAALGDFRKGLKLNPDNKEAQSMHDQIVDIFKSMNREPPKEGEEPPPAPFKKP